VTEENKEFLVDSVRDSKFDAALSETLETWKELINRLATT
jgi:hypothetical protein